MDYHFAASQCFEGSVDPERWKRQSDVIPGEISVPVDSSAGECFPRPRQPDIDIRGSSMNLIVHRFAERYGSAVVESRTGSFSRKAESICLEAERIRKRDRVVASVGVEVDAAGQSYGILGGVNLYAYAGNNPVAFSDPFGLCIPPDSPQCRFIVGVARRVAPLERTMNRIGNGTGINGLGRGAAMILDGQILQGGGQVALALAPIVTGGSSGGVRVGPRLVEGTLARTGAKLGNLLSKLDRSHLSAAARELKGFVSGWDHVTEVREAAAGTRNVIKSLNGVLGNPNINQLEREAAERFLGTASRALDAAEKALR